MAPFYVTDKVYVSTLSREITSPINHETIKQFVVYVFHAKGLTLLFTGLSWFLLTGKIFVKFGTKSENLNEKKR